MRANAMGMVVAVAELEGRAFERVASSGGGRRTAMVEGRGSEDGEETRARR